MELNLLIAIVLVIAFYLVIAKNGKLGFWRKASKRPNFVYEQLVKSDAWELDNGVTKFNKKEYVGPFLLYVPRLNKTVKFFGKIGKYESNQKSIEEKMRLLDISGAEY